MYLCLYEVSKDSDVGNLSTVSTHVYRETDFKRPIIQFKKLNYT